MIWILVFAILFLIAVVYLGVRIDDLERRTKTLESRLGKRNSQ